MYSIKDTLVDEFGGSFVVESENIHCCMWKNDNQNFVRSRFNYGNIGEKINYGDQRHQVETSLIT